MQLLTIIEGDEAREFAGGIVRYTWETDKTFDDRFRANKKLSGPSVKLPSHHTLGSILDDNF